MQGIQERPTSGKSARAPAVQDDFANLVRTLAEGPCLCSEIDPSDRPCLTCDAQHILTKPVHRARRRPAGRP